LCKNDSLPASPGARSVHSRQDATVPKATGAARPAFW
jgi:hypothetical protein